MLLKKQFAAPGPPPVPPLVVIEQLFNGVGLAVNPNVASPPVVFLMTWMKPGKMTASAESERSWFPPAPSRSINRVWYGEPEIDTAEPVRPQSVRVEMWPPQARTGLEVVATKLIVIAADL